MNLPSIHSPNGLSIEDQRRVITVGTQARRIHTNMSQKGIYDSNSEFGQYAIEDVEMMPMDDMEEAQLISDMVTSSRIENNFDMSDDMDLDKHILQTTTVSLQGNISYLIIDTNFILSQLQILDELKNIGEKYGLVIVIPIQVVRELDGLKSSKGRISNDLQDISILARTANDWIFSCLAQRCPTVKGQARGERLDKFTTKDDAILDCCLYYKSEYKHTLQILFSNDKNLCSKALMNEVLTISYQKGMSSQLIAEKIYEENMMRFGYIDPSSVANVEVEVPNQGYGGSPEQICQRVYSEVQTVAVHVVSLCMLSEYGDDIELIREYDQDSILTLDDAVMVMIRFWFPVFSDGMKGCEPFDENGSRKVPKMVDVPRSSLELMNFVDFWGKLFVRLYENNKKLQGIESIQQHASRWHELARSII